MPAARRTKNKAKEDVVADNPFALSQQSLSSDDGSVQLLPRLSNTDLLTRNFLSMMQAVAQQMQCTSDYGMKRIRCWTTRTL